MYLGVNKNEEEDLQRPPSPCRYLLASSGKQAKTWKSTWSPFRGRSVSDIKTRLFRFAALSEWRWEGLEESRWEGGARNQWWREVTHTEDLLQR